MPNRSISWIFTHGRAIVQYYPNSGVKYILVLNSSRCFIQIINYKLSYFSKKMDIRESNMEIYWMFSKFKMSLFIKVL